MRVSIESLGPIDLFGSEQRKLASTPDKNYVNYGKLAQFEAIAKVKS
jgi:hypothetical protein